MSIAEETTCNIAVPLFILTSSHQLRIVTLILGGGGRGIETASLIPWA